PVLQGLPRQIVSRRLHLHSTHHCRGDPPTGCWASSILRMVTTFIVRTDPRQLLRTVTAPRVNGHGDCRGNWYRVAEIGTVSPAVQSLLPGRVRNFSRGPGAAGAPAEPW